MTDAAAKRRRTHSARLIKKASASLIPRRASTRAWMMLTFALFVGAVVTIVGISVIMVLKKHVHDAAYGALVERAYLTAELVYEAPPSREGRGRVVDNINRLAPFKAIVALDGQIYGGSAAELNRHLGSIGEWKRPRAGVDLSPLQFIPDADGKGSRHLVGLRMANPSTSLIVHQSAGPFESIIRRAETALVIGMLLILAMSLLGALISAQQVIKPLDAIRNSARSISEGNFEERIRVDSRASEFQDLARRLNQMADSLHEKIVELQRLTQLQSEFIGNVSHEVRNPIFAVGGYLEALSTSTLKEEQRQRYAEKGLMNLQRLNNLFNDLIEIARLEYRDDLVQPRVFDLQELIDEIADTLRPKALEKGLHLETGNDSIFVSADRNRIRQVLVNLIDNAIAYTDEGSVRCRHSRRLDKVRIEVIDTGKGIADEHLERIFERFYRIDPDRSRKSGGTGLGLSIVKQILHAHGESIHVESTVGRGTRFWFELPYSETPPEPLDDLA